MDCLGPISIRNPDETSPERFIRVPCGKCAACLSRKRNEWSYRLECELKHSVSAFFITLTYDDVNVPDDGFGRLSLRKKDCQLFLKRLRKSLPDWHIRYYLCGEYGSNTHRPHYHAVMFGLPPDESLSYEEVLRAWQKGFVQIGTVTPASIAYVTKYCITKAEEMDEFDTRERPFALMSRRPGLGADYIDSHKSWHLADESRFYSPKMDGQKVSLPRYFKEKIYDEKQRKRYAAKCAAEALERRREQIRKYEESGRSVEAYCRDSYDRKVRYTALLKKKIDKMQKF